jgi:hypothetical protein
MCIVLGQALLIMGIIVLMDIDWGTKNIEVNSDSLPLQISVMVVLSIRSNVVHPGLRLWVKVNIRHHNN